MVSLDWRVDLDAGWKRLGHHLGVQGNLDPVLLLAGSTAMLGEASRILETLGRGPFIFNLSHGILPETPVAHVVELVEQVRGHCA